MNGNLYLMLMFQLTIVSVKATKSLINQQILNKKSSSCNTTHPFLKSYSMFQVNHAKTYSSSIFYISGLHQRL